MTTKARRAKRTTSPKAKRRRPVAKMSRQAWRDLPKFLSLPGGDVLVFSILQRRDPEIARSLVEALPRELRTSSPVFAHLCREILAAK